MKPRTLKPVKRGSLFDALWALEDRLTSAGEQGCSDDVLLPSAEWLNLLRLANDEREAANVVREVVRDEFHVDAVLGADVLLPDAEWRKLVGLVKDEREAANVVREAASDLAVVAEREVNHQLDIRLEALRSELAAAKRDLEQAKSALAYANAELASANELISERDAELSILERDAELRHANKEISKSSLASPIPSLFQVKNNAGKDLSVAVGADAAGFVVTIGTIGRQCDFLPAGAQRVRVEPFSPGESAESDGGTVEPFSPVPASKFVGPFSARRTEACEPGPITTQLGPYDDRETAKRKGKREFPAGPFEVIDSTGAVVETVENKKKKPKVTPPTATSSTPVPPSVPEPHPTPFVPDATVPAATPEVR